MKTSQNLIVFLVQLYMWPGQPDCLNCFIYPKPFNLDKATLSRSDGFLEGLKMTSQIIALSAYCKVNAGGDYLNEVCGHQCGTPSPASLAVHIHRALARLRLVQDPGDTLVHLLVAGCLPVNSGEVEESHLEFYGNHPWHYLGCSMICCEGDQNGLRVQETPSSFHPSPRYEQSLSS